MPKPAGSIRIRFNPEQPFAYPQVILPDGRELPYISLTLECGPWGGPTQDPVVTLKIYAGRVVPFDELWAKIKEVISVCDHCGFSMYHGTGHGA